MVTLFSGNTVHSVYTLLHQCSPKWMHKDRPAHSLTTSSRKTFFWIISPLRIPPPPPLLSQREPNCAVAWHTGEPEGGGGTDSNGNPTLLTFSWQSHLPWMDDADRGYSGKGQIWVCEFFIKGYCRFLMCLKVRQSKWWLAAIIPQSPKHHFHAAVLFILQRAFLSSPLLLSHVLEG